MENSNSISKHWIALLLAVLVFLVNQLPFLEDIRPVMYDEAWYSNTAYNLCIGNGIHQTSVGMGGNANCVFPLIGAAFFSVFGYSLFSIRLASVFCGLVTLVVMHFIMNELNVSLHGRLLVYLLFVSMPLFNTTFRFARPECASIMGMAGGVLFYLRYWRTHSWTDMACLSLLCVLATNAHPFALYGFLFFGVALLIDVCQGQEWKRLSQLAVLVVAALLGIGLLFLLSLHYNEESTSSLLFSRASLTNWKESVSFYYKEVFVSRYAIYSFVVLLILVLTTLYVKERRVSLLAFLSIINGLSFPFLFSTDLMMVGYGWSYVSLISVILVAPLADALPLSKLLKKWAFAGMVLYSMGCFSLSYYYNYKVKYERCNSVLGQDVSKIIPKGAVVYGPLRQWFCAIETTYYSDHYRYELPKEFDYLIFNSQDKELYENNERVLPLIDSYELIYNRDTKQYGEVLVYKKRKE